MHGGEEDLPETLMAPRPLEECHGLLETVNRLTIVTLGQVGEAEVLVRQRMQDNIPAGRGEREGSLGGSDSLAICTHEAEMV